MIETLFTDYAKRGWAKGYAEGKAEVVLLVLKHRAIRVTAARRKLVLACGDNATLDRWLDAALDAHSAKDVFASKPSRRSPRAHRGAGETRT